MVHVTYIMSLQVDNVVTVCFCTHSMMNTAIIPLLSNPSEMMELHLMAVAVSQQTLCMCRTATFVHVFLPLQMQNTMVHGTGMVLFTSVCNYTEMISVPQSNMSET